MTFFFAWVKNSELFDPKKHSRCDEKILSVDMHDQDNRLPYVDLRWIPTDGDWTSVVGRHVWLSWRHALGDVRPLFYGVVDHVHDVGSGDAMMRIVLGVTHDTHALLKNLLTPMIDMMDDALPLPDPAPSFYPVLPQDPSKIAYDRVTTLPYVYKMGQGDVVNRINVVDARGMDIHMSPFPGPLDVTIIAQWIQSIQGAMDLSSRLGHPGDGGCLSTFTPKDLMTKWSQIPSALHKTGYVVLESRLDPTHPPQTVGLDLYPDQSDVFYVGRRKRRLQRYWFHPRLRVGWFLNQKRTEIVTCRLLSPSPTNHHGPGQSMVIHVGPLLSSHGLWVPQAWYGPGDRVQHGKSIYACRDMHQSGDVFDDKLWDVVGTQALDDPSISSFFKTDRGQNVLTKAIMMAVHRMMEKMYGMLVHLAVSFDQGTRLAIGDRVRISHPHIPGGSSLGHVVGIHAWIKDGQASCDLKILCPFPGSNNLSFPPIELDFDQIKTPEDTFASPHGFAPDALVYRSSVVHHGGEQNQILSGKTFHSLGDVHQTLQSCRTNVALHLRALRPQPNITTTHDLGLIYLGSMST